MSSGVTTIVPPEREYWSSGSCVSPVTVTVTEGVPVGAAEAVLSVP